eukprot:3304548-Alexandrium_andersonii.AAC.1
MSLWPLRGAASAKLHMKGTRAALGAAPPNQRWNRPTPCTPGPRARGRRLGGPEAPASLDKGMAL